jgi:hypothetical protein
MPDESEKIQNLYNDMLRTFGSTLELTSRDTVRSVYMTSCKKQVVDFDKFKTDFSKKLSLGEMPKSCDALCMFSNNELFLIEFKNGQIDDKIRFDIRRKVFESLLMLTEQFNITTGFTRCNMTFILVYNENNEHSGKTKIAKGLSTLAKDNSFSQFLGLHYFEKLYFRKASAYSRAEFEANFVGKI